MGCQSGRSLLDRALLQPPLDQCSTGAPWCLCAQCAARVQALQGYLSSSEISDDLSPSLSATTYSLQGNSHTRPHKAYLSCTLCASAAATSALHNIPPLKGKASQLQHEHTCLLRSASRWPQPRACRICSSICASFLSGLLNLSIYTIIREVSVYPGVSPGFAFLLSRAAGRALQVVQRLSGGGGRCLLCFGGGGRGEMQIAAADRGRACARVSYKGTGTPLLHFSPSALRTGTPQIAGRRLSLSQAAGSSQRGFHPPLSSQIVSFAPLIARQI